MGQKESDHDRYDKPPNGVTLDTSNLDSFDGLVGARDAIAGAITILDFFRSGTAWASPEDRRSSSRTRCSSCPARSRPRTTPWYSARRVGGGGRRGRCDRDWRSLVVIEAVVAAFPDTTIDPRNRAVNR